MSKVCSPPWAPWDEGTIEGPCIEISLAPLVEALLSRSIGPFRKADTHLTCPPQHLPHVSESTQSLQKLVVSFFSSSFFPEPTGFSLRVPGNCRVEVSQVAVPRHLVFPMSHFSCAANSSDFLFVPITHYAHGMSADVSSLTRSVYHVDRLRRVCKRPSTTTPLNSSSF